MKHLEKEPALIPPSMTARLTVEHGFQSLFSLAFHPAGTLVAGGGDVPIGGEKGATHGTVALWDVATGREVRWFEAQSAPVLSVAFSPDGQLLASASYTLGRRAEAWRVPFTGVTGQVVYAVGISPDGHTLASAGDEDLQLWDISC